MVKINKVYTRTGDEGETGLVGGGGLRRNTYVSKPTEPLMSATV